MMISHVTRDVISQLLLGQRSNSQF